MKTGCKANNNGVLRPVLLLLNVGLFLVLFGVFLWLKSGKAEEVIKSKILRLQLQMGLHLGLQNEEFFVVMYRGYLSVFGALKWQKCRIEGVLLQGVIWCKLLNNKKFM
ncbi:MAG: hypothetical protein IJ759_00970 [Bacteroidales bacterium]|nr:hypothetical protein [Bacteroidales bacterium]